MPPGTQEPTLEDVIREFVRAGTAKMRISFPATVVVYDPVTQTATIQPALHSRVDDVLLDVERPEATPPPQLSGVPVVWPSGGGAASPWSVHGPLAPGDPVTVLVAERSTDEWRALGAPTNVPQDARRFDVSDAVCYPGGRCTNPGGPNPLTTPLAPTAVDPAALVLAGLLVKLGGAAAVDQALKGTIFEADLLTWATALDELLLALSTPLAPPAYVTAVSGAAATFTTEHNTFKATLTGAHRSTKVFVE